MKKKILCLAMTVIMAAGVHTTAFAKDYQGADGWQVNFTGGKMESNFKSSDVTDELANIQPGDRLKTLSKGTKEKIQLILVMSRDADLYILDEPIAGVDPAARDYIMKTILNNYNPEASLIISTHLISDIESILDDVIFIKNGQLVLQASVDEIREKQGKTVDAYFREVFAC